MHIFYNHLKILPCCPQDSAKHIDLAQLKTAKINFMSDENGIIAKYIIK